MSVPFQSSVQQKLQTQSQCSTDWCHFWPETGAFKPDVFLAHGSSVWNIRARPKFTVKLRSNHLSNHGRRPPNFGPSMDGNSSHLIFFATPLPFFITSNLGSLSMLSLMLSFHLSAEKIRIVRWLLTCYLCTLPCRIWWQAVNSHVTKPEHVCGLSISSRLVWKVFHPWHGDFTFVHNQNPRVKRITSGIVSVLMLLLIEPWKAGISLKMWMITLLQMQSYQRNPVICIKYIQILSSCSSLTSSFRLSSHRMTVPEGWQLRRRLWIASNRPPMAVLCHHLTCVKTRYINVHV